MSGFDDLRLEDLEGFADERIVFEVFGRGGGRGGWNLDRGHGFNRRRRRFLLFEFRNPGRGDVGSHDDLEANGIGGERRIGKLSILIKIL